MNSGPLFDLILILFLILISAFFSLSETSFTASSISKIHKLKADGNKRASILLKLLKKRENIISLTLFGNNAVNIFASSMATVLAIKCLSGYAGIEQYAPEIASVVMTFVILIFAEIIPKSIAIKNPERLAVSNTAVYVFLLKVFGPLVNSVNQMALKFVAIFGFKTNTSEIYSATDVIRGEIEYFHSQGSVVKNDRDMLGGVLDLVETDVETIMTHRKDVNMIDLDDSVQEIVKFVENIGHSRFPVYQGGHENVIGILHIRDLFTLRNNKNDLTCADIKAILLAPIFVSANTRLKTQLLEFRKKRSHMAIVVDEYGGMMGVITLEDILEEIVGSIEDEHDQTSRSVVKESEGVYIVNGDCLIRDFNREIGSDFDTEDASTMAGLVIEKAEKIPDRSEEFVIDGFRFTVIKKDVNKITSMRVEKLVDSQADEAEKLENEYIDQNNV